VLVLGVGLALSVVVGLARLRAEVGRVYSKGTPLTIGLFLGLAAAKVAIGTVCYFLKISDDGGFGEVLVMIAIMIAFQAEIVWRRAQALGRACRRSFRPDPKPVRWRRSAAGWCRGPSTCTGRATTLVR
jgi:hypothetical protein